MKNANLLTTRVARFIKQVNLILEPIEILVVRVFAFAALFRELVRVFWHGR